MFSVIIKSFLALFISTAIVRAGGIVRTSTSSVRAALWHSYPPSGLLDSLHSMKVREELYQSELSEFAARQLVIEPVLALPKMDPTATGILASMSSIESLYRSLLLSDRNGQTSSTPCPTTTSSYLIPEFTIAPTIRPPLPALTSEMINYATPQTSNAPQPHVLISIVWVIVISFIIGMTLYSALNGLGTFILVFLVLNVICAVVAGAHAHPHPEPRRRPIGGLHPGPLGKIPCGPVRGRIGTKHGHGFVHGVDRKVGGLRQENGELMCDDWSNAKSLFGRGVVIRTPPAAPAGDEMVETTTIYTTMETTVWVTVEDTATSNEPREPTSTTADSAPALPTVAEPTRSQIPLSDLVMVERESSAVPQAVNIRHPTSSLFLLYLLGVFLCLHSGGTSGALSYVVIGLALIATIGGAEAVTMLDPTGLHNSVGWRVAGLRPADAANVRDSQEVRVWNGTHTIMRSAEGAKLREICGEVYCHNWLSTEHETQTLTTPKPTPIYAELFKRLSTEYVTVTPTTGIIGIFGPQIIPITVDSTAYENIVISTVEVERVRTTRTKVITIDGSEPTAPGLMAMSKTNGMGGFRMTTLTAIPSDEVRFTMSSSPASAVNAEEKVEAKTVFVTTTRPPPPPSMIFITTTVTASPGVSLSFSPDNTSSAPTNELPGETPSPARLPATSSASHLDPSQLYLSFVETNLYCYLVLFIGLQIAWTTSHPFIFLGSMGVIIFRGAVAK